MTSRPRREEPHATTAPSANTVSAALSLYLSIEKSLLAPCVNAGVQRSVLLSHPAYVREREREQGGGAEEGDRHAGDATTCSREKRRTWIDVRKHRHT